MANLPQGVAGSAQWVDLLGEGLSGVLTTDPSGQWFYKSNISPVSDFDGVQSTKLPLKPSASRAPRPRLGPMSRLGVQPDVGPNLSFADPDGNGTVALMVAKGSTPGYFVSESDPATVIDSTEESWSTFVPCASWPTLDLNDPYMRFIDLTGNGKADLLITLDDRLLWYESVGVQGYRANSHSVGLALEEDQGPRVVFAGSLETVHLSDMTGDGMIDIVRIRNRDVCYWPNLGYGRFGAKVTMDNAPDFAREDSFTSSNLVMGDIDGSGTTDLIYFHSQGARLYYNQAGNSWSAAISVQSWPTITPGMSVTAVDLLGTGTMSLVWSSSRLGDSPLQYVDLCDGQKPHLLSKVSNSLGKETWVTYRSSTAYSVEDKLNGQPWLTRLPHPVHCVAGMVNYDQISRVCFSTRYAYHHGFWDPIEREFRGFGLVETWDTEDLDQLVSPEGVMNQDRQHYVPPVYTRTWYHTGAYTQVDRLAQAYSKDYFRTSISDSLTHTGTQQPFYNQQLFDRMSYEGFDGGSEETRQATRALKGSVLRSEIYADDGTVKAHIPYQIEQNGNAVRMLQPRGDVNRYAVFITHVEENLVCHLERDTANSRAAQSLVLEVDYFGNPCKTVSVAYGRMPPQSGSSGLSPPDEVQQNQNSITYAEANYTNPWLEMEDFRTPAGCAQRTWEISCPFSPDPTWGRYEIAQFSGVGAFSEVPFEQPVDRSLEQKRLIDHAETTFRHDDLSGLLDVGQLQALALPGVNYQLCMTNSIIAAAFQSTGKALLSSPPAKAGYVERPGLPGFWIPSSRSFYHEDPQAAPQQELARAQQSFYCPRRIQDPFGADTVSGYDPYFLNTTRVQDAKGNTVSTEIDYRTMSPRTTTDPNGNRTMIAYDALGIATGHAVMGKVGQQVGDNLDGFRATLTDEEVDAYFADPKAHATVLLGPATSRNIYRMSYSSTSDDISPPWASTIAREQHVSQLPPSSPQGKQPNVKTRLGFAYFDGSQRSIQSKAQAEPAATTPTSSRWRCTGWTILNNKGSTVEQFEPFFDTSHRFQFDQRAGVSSLTLYDSLNRPIGAVYPNNTWTKQVINPWLVSDWDSIDTLELDIRTDPDVGPMVAAVAASRLAPTWLQSCTSPNDKDAAAKAVKLAGTPSVVHLDAMGRPFLAIADTVVSGKIETRTKYDIQGHVLEIVDGLGRTVTKTTYDMCGRAILVESTDSGARWEISAIDSKPLQRWDSRGTHLRSDYDVLRRPIGTSLITPEREIVIQRLVYGEDEPNASDHNLRGQVVRTYDQAGVVDSEDWDFTGNKVSEVQQFAAEYESDINWSDVQAVQMLPGSWKTTKIYNALGQVTSAEAPDQSVMTTTFNDAGLEDSVSVQLKGKGTITKYASSTEYDAFGRMTKVTCGNGSVTTYAFDPLTHRLLNQVTLLSRSKSSKVIQNLAYTYDPVGNPTTVSNKIDDGFVFKQWTAGTSCDYTYDGTYRLVRATGWENLGQTKGAPTAPGKLASHANINNATSSPTDFKSMAQYVETYSYDAGNSITSLIHQFLDSKTPGWTRNFSHEAAGSVRQSNRLVSTAVGSTTESYQYDANGNMVSTPQLQSVQWDYLNQMRSCSTQKVTSGIPETTYYRYDSSGKRVRKVTTRHTTSASETPTKLSERLTVVGCDFYKEYKGDGVTVSQSCDTIKIEGASGCIAVVEDWSGTNHGSFRLNRYQLSNAQGSVTVEIDEACNVLSYEGFTPFGSSSYQMPTSRAPKRFRYMGKERDSESGLYYVERRYYLPWLCRWLNPDPIGTSGGLNVFTYAANNPILYHDPGGMMFRRGSNSMDEDEPASSSSSSSSSSDGSSFSSSSSSSASSAMTAAPATTHPLDVRFAGRALVGLASSSPAAPTVVSALSMFSSVAELARYRAEMTSQSAASVSFNGDSEAISAGQSADLTMNAIRNSARGVSIPFPSRMRTDAILNECLPTACRRGRASFLCSATRSAYP
jgi:RHS repeat-associated protein